MKPLPFDIDNVTLNVLIGVATFAIALMSFASEITEDQFKFFKSLSFRIVYLTLFSFIIIWASVIKDKNSDVRNENDVATRDSLNHEKFKKDLLEMTSSSSHTTAETMAKYYLKYDSIQNKIEKIIKDTSNRTNKITEKFVTTDAKPEFNISDIKFDKLRNDSLQFTFTLICKKTAIKNLNLGLKMCVEKQGSLYFVPQLRGFMPHNINLASNVPSYVHNLTFTTLNNIYQAYFYITGSYFYENEEVPVEFIFYYDFRNSQFGVPGNPDVIVNFLKPYM